MSSDPSALIERSIVLLEDLAAIFAQEVCGVPREVAAADAGSRCRKEILLSVSVLLPKLRAVQGLIEAPPAGGCARCAEE